MTAVGRMAVAFDCSAYAVARYAQAEREVARARRLARVREIQRRIDDDPRRAVAILRGYQRDARTYVRTFPITTKRGAR